MCPCKDCLDRKLGCHSSCRDYLEWKAGIVKEPKDVVFLDYVKDSRTKYIRKAMNHGKRKY